MPRPTPGAVVGLREAASLLGISRRAVLRLVESDRLALHGVVRGHAVFLRGDVLAQSARVQDDASRGPMRWFLRAGESWSAWLDERAQVLRRHAAESRRYARHEHRRDRPATGDGPRVVWLRTSGVRCDGCRVPLSSGRDQVRISSDGARWWLCRDCGDASGAIVPEPLQRRAG